MFNFVVLYRVEGDDEAREWERFQTYAEAIAKADAVIGTDAWTGARVTAAWVEDISR